MSNKKGIFCLLLLFNAMQLYSMDKNISSKCTLFSTAILKKQTNQYFTIFSKLQTPLCYNLLDFKVIKYKIHNSFLLWSRIEASSGDQLKIRNSLLLGVDIINKYGDKSVPHQNIQYQNAVIISKNQLLISIGLILGLYFLRKT